MNQPTPQPPVGTGGTAGPSPVLVLGVGNLLVGDEGVGIHAVRLLETQPWPAHVRLLDGGTGGFHLLEEFQKEQQLILIDATLDGRPPGTVTCFKATMASDFPPALGAHDIGLRDLFSTAALLGRLPETQVITISVKTLEPMCLDLSTEVAAALPRVAELVRSRVMDTMTVGDQIKANGTIMRDPLCL